MDDDKSQSADETVEPKQEVFGPKAQELIDNLRSEVRQFRAAADKAAGQSIVDPELQTKLARLKELEDAATARENEEAKKKGDFETLLANIEKKYQDEIAELRSKAESSSKRADTLAADLAKAKLDHDKAIATQEGNFTSYQLETEVMTTYVASGANTANGAKPTKLFKMLYPEIKQYIRRGESGVTEVLDGNGTIRLNGDGKPMSLSEYMETLKSDTDTAFFFAPPPQSTGSGKTQSAYIGAQTTKLKSIPSSYLSSANAQAKWCRENGVEPAKLHEELRAKRVLIDKTK